MNLSENKRKAHSGNDRGNNNNSALNVFETSQFVHLGTQA